MVFKDTTRLSLKAFNINPSSQKQATSDRTKWRAAVHRGAPQHNSATKSAVEK